jgi:hypothetical protein
MAAADVEGVSETLRLRLALAVEDATHRLDVEHVVLGERSAVLTFGLAGEFRRRIDWTDIDVLAVKEGDGEERGAEKSDVVVHELHRDLFGYALDLGCAGEDRAEAVLVSREQEAIPVERNDPRRDRPDRLAAPPLPDEDRPKEPALFVVLRVLFDEEDSP